MILKLQLVTAVYEVKYFLDLSLAGVPEHANQSRDSSRLEDGQQTLPLMGQVVKDAGRCSGRLHVTCVLHCSHHCSHHLRRLHQCAP